jgi:threonine synthase
VQKQQMLACEGGSVHVVGVDGDFDFCQAAVKAIFRNGAMAAALKAEANLKLSSANSINWGRLLPQIVYYFHSYKELVAAGKIARGDAIDVCVPTGNFGNILACYIAKKLGLPVGKFVLASNANDVLFTFFQTGVYDITDRTLSLTASPSIDILKASNVERFLFLVSGNDAALVRGLMAQLEAEKKFAVPAHVLAEMQASFWTMRCDERQCRATIRATAQGSPAKTLIDPHTAVAVYAAERYVADVASAATVVLVSSTAHWAKFPKPVLQALKGEDDVSGLSAGDATGNAASADDVRAMYREILALCPGATVAAPLQAVFDAAEGAAPVAPRHLPASLDAIEAELREFVAPGWSQ